MRRWIATGLLAAVLGTTLPTMALASVSGRRNTALGLAGAALYTWLNGGTNHAGRRNTALLLTGGAIYAYTRYAQARKAEKRARLASYYRDRYYSSGPYSRVSGYRSYYSRRTYVRRAYGGRYAGRRTARRRYSTAYARGYQAGYRRGVRVCQTRHRYSHA
jgi:hypothetical protein